MGSHPNIPTEIKKICFNYFYKFKHFKSLKKRSLCMSKHNEITKTTFINMAFRSLCPGAVCKSELKLIVTHYNSSTPLFAKLFPIYPIFDRFIDDIAMLMIMLQYQEMNSFMIEKLLTSLERNIQSIDSEEDLSDVLSFMFTKDFGHRSFQILHVLASRNISYSVKFPNIFGNVLRNLFVVSTEKNGIIAWKLLNIGFDDESLLQILCSFVDKNCDLLRIDIVSNLRILNKKKQGNVENAEESLKIAVAVCYKINKAFGKKENAFKILYNKLQKTESIKHIIEEINQKFQNNEH